VRLLALDMKAATRNGGGLLGSLCGRPYREVAITGRLIWRKTLGTDKISVCPDPGAFHEVDHPRTP